jgi:hypothetical protein
MKQFNVKLWAHDDDDDEHIFGSHFLLSLSLRVVLTHAARVTSMIAMLEGWKRDRSIKERSRSRVVADIESSPSIRL